MSVEAVRISAIIPVYNTALELPRCLDSALGQAFEGLEVIAVDDGSTDGSPEVCARYAQRDARVRVLIVPHGGAGAARNAGLNVARGAYVLFLDSDDALEDGALQALWEAAWAEKLDIVRCCRRLEDARGARVETRRARLPREVLAGAAFFREAVERGAYSCHVGTGLFRRAFLAEAGIRFPEGIVCEDELFMPEALLRARRVRYIDRCLYRHILREGSVMRGDPERRGRDMVRIARILADMSPLVPEDCRRAWERNLLGKYFCGYTLARLYRRENREAWLPRGFALRHAHGAKDVLRACLCEMHGPLFCALNAAGMRVNRWRGVVRS